ncbi:MAG: arginine--tRNA ligase [Chloroflexota bacterium]
MFEVEQQAIEGEIRSFANQKGWQLPEVLKWSSIPFAGEWGISTSFFQVAANEARTAKSGDVPERAQEMAQQVAAYLGAPSGISRVEAVNGYLNLYFEPAEFSRRVILAVLQQGKDFGRGAPKGQRIMVEFSQPNTHKAFHVGHLRSAILGDVVCRILEFAGYEVIRANYYGDIGLHVIRWLWNYQKHHANEKPKEDITRWMGDLYAEATRRIEENPELEAEVRELYARWDRRDPQVVALWEETRQWSLDGFNEMYEILDIRFDRLYANSEVEQPGKEIVEELIQRGIAEDERPDGPVIVRIDDLLGLKKEKYRVMVILRSDDTALYQTLDLALALLKFKEYKLGRSIYVVDVRQSLHFQQVWKILEIAGFEVAKQCQHLAYELVNLPGDVTMASREGTVVLLEDLIREATNRALQVVQMKNPSLDETQKQKVAWAVGLGALKYPILARENTKIVTFDWESALDFEGQAAPYIQYAYVRANSILKRANIDPSTLKGYSGTPEHPLEAAEVELIEQISLLPVTVQRAAEELKPLHITNLAYEMARAFNNFYNLCPVLQAEEPVRSVRLHLVAASRLAIANTLALLGIRAPEVM